MFKYKIPDNLIKRVHYISLVEPFIGQSIIKVFTGQRRVGKSFILFQLMQVIKEREPDATILYINKEDLVFAEIKTAKDLNDYVINHRKTGKMTYVFIDEIQEIHEFEKALRSLLLHKKTDLYCTGSNATLLSGELASLLSGRFIDIRIYSLSYKEFLMFHKLDNEDISLEKYFKYGGLPYLKHLPLRDEIVFEYLKNIYTTIVYRDIIDRYGVRNTRLLEQLIVFIANHTGSLFSSKSISDFLKSQKIRLAPNQIQSYVDYLVNAFLIHRVERFDIIGKRIFEIGEKYYFENTGIRNGIVGYNPQDLSKLLENVVYNHLLFKGYKIKVGLIKVDEIDFICEKSGEKIYVQVALSLKKESTIEREFGNLKKIKDNYPKMVITMDIFEGDSYDGIKHINIRDFLKMD